MKFDDKKAVKIPTKVIVPVVTCAIGILFASIAFGQYGFWDSVAMKPTKGFFPGIISIGLIALSVLAFINGLKSPTAEFRLINWYVPLAVLLIIAATYVIGMIPSLLIFVFLWLKVYEKQSWTTTIIALLIVSFIVIGCFRIWLDIQFPIGFIGELIFG
ncbi:MAG: tripartite tricarboxylate transporter TctB family protein [Candidatus Ornithospirochaeta sp.]|nr:tripartite tricarboxylate transporter TctB family protein [Sphaerochaetaceae bacterium]MDD7161837.1 tripartite tricarboxylate transporter TctB family protein [Sphaerochaetaceae bacterium]MDY5522826.1 tripartite tricarboxylate transporter TctB family protein [Candidatus Ornithospirochaeta sp.]